MQGAVSFWLGRGGERTSEKISTSRHGHKLETRMIGAVCTCVRQSSQGCKAGASADSSSSTPGRGEERGTLNKTHCHTNTGACFRLDRGGGGIGRGVGDIWGMAYVQWKNQQRVCGKGRLIVTRSAYFEVEKYFRGLIREGK